MRKMLFPALLVVLLLASMSVNAGERVLTINQGETNASFFITGEQTLVINGFDLTPLGLALPATIDRVSIAVDTPVQGASATVVVYQDSNGGSPVDATLLAQAPVNITGSGVFSATLPTPATVTAPVVWVGFYLPVNFRFLADQSGSSVLTYWAWTPNSTFDLSRLSTAAVLGPSNGTPPVSIDMKGIARITAEITGNKTVTTTPGTPLPTTVAALGTPAALVTQVAAAANTDLSVMRQYHPACDTMSWDSADVGVTYRGAIEVRCTAIWPGYAPSAPLGYERMQLYYDLTIYDDRGNPVSGPIPLPVTHCILANPADIDRAVIGIAYGSPRRFEILPTLRVGNLICAEITRSGGVSYFVPKPV